MSVGQESTITRGFLFADLRGYTDFVEQRGAAAAAPLLTQYRALAREEIAQFGGAEIKTEGDSFYVVFDSLSFYRVDPGPADGAGDWDLIKQQDFGPPT